MKRTWALIVACVFTICLYSNVQADDWNASGDGGAVAGGRTSKSVDAGLEMLKQYGKAADAAAATILVLAIEDYGLFCIGGEVPFIHYDAEKKEVKVLSGQGRAPLDTQAIEWLLNNGIPNISNSDNIKSATVPAVIDLCVQAMKLWGVLTFEDVAQPALKILDQGGISWYVDLAATLRKLVEAEQNTVGTREEKLQAVSDRFYRGDIADDLDSWYQQNGGFLRKEDLEKHVTNLEDPLSIDYRGYTVYKCDTWTQGAVLLQSLRLLEGFDLKSMGHLSADYIHVVTEAMKLAFADRDEYYADPEFEDIPLDKLLSDEYTELRRPLIDMSRASDTIKSGDPINMLAINPNPHPNLKWPKGTTTCCVVDQWGNVVACTPSGWGSNAGVGTTGVAHGTRLISILNWDDHPNRIAPGKRPCITLTPSLVCKDGKPILAISVAGGDMQDQTTLNLFLDFVEFDIMPKDAVIMSRFNTEHLTGFFSQPIPKLAHLQVNTGVPSSVRDELKQRGHNLLPTLSAIAAPVMIYIDQSTGIFYAAGDPNAGRKVGAVDIITGTGKFSDPSINALCDISVNPKHNGVEITYKLSNQNNVRLSIYNLKGHLILCLPTAKVPGTHTVMWNGRNKAGNRVSAGCYIVKLFGEGKMASKRFVLSH